MLFGPILWATGFSCRLHRWLEQVVQVDQVVGHHVQAKYGTDVPLAAQFELLLSAESLQPSEHLFDATAGIDRPGIAHVAGGAAIDC